MSGETEEQESGWTVDTLKYHMDQRFESSSESLRDLRTMLDERYQTQTKATDAAFAAQQKAMETAFIAADKAVQAALQAAKEAVNKAEVAAEKRFESVNEFRGQLADQANTFMPRTEVAAAQQRNSERIDDISKRLERAEGNRTGMLAAVGISVSLAAILVTIVIAIVKFGST